MAIVDWIDLFSNFKLTNGISSKSDHYPIIIKLDAVKRRLFLTPFRFKNSWLLEPNLGEVVSAGWEKASDFLSKINSCTVDMNSWGKSIRRNFTDQIDVCRKELEQIRQSQSHDQNN